LLRDVEFERGRSEAGSSDDGDEPA
jgi:hypothetical protein